MALVLITLVIAVALLGAMDLMFRLGRRRRAHYDEQARSQLTTVQASTLGLLALLLGFTISMAESRFNARRQVNLQEALAVGTTYLRVDLLPEPERSESRALVRQYVAERRAYYHAEPDEVAAVIARTEALQLQLWRRAATAAQAHPEWYSLTTYVTSLNQMIDLELARSLVIVARLPPEILVVTLVVALVGIAITGFMTGVAGGRSVFALYVIPILIALTCALIVDLDRARFGFIATGDAPMARVERSLDMDAGPAAGSR